MFLESIHLHILTTSPSLLLTVPFCTIYMMLLMDATYGYLQISAIKTSLLGISLHRLQVDQLTDSVGYNKMPFTFFTSLIKEVV